VPVCIEISFSLTVCTWELAHESSCPLAPVRRFWRESETYAPKSEEAKRPSCPANTDLKYMGRNRLNARHDAQLSDLNSIGRRRLKDSMVVSSPLVVRVNIGSLLRYVCVAGCLIRKSAATKLAGLVYCIPAHFHASAIGFHFPDAMWRKIIHGDFPLFRLLTCRSSIYVVTMGSPGSHDLQPSSAMPLFDALPNYPELEVHAAAGHGRRCGLLPRHVGHHGLGGDQEARD
jgi:hypothetical protein